MAKQSKDAGKGRAPNVVKKSAKGSQKNFYTMLGLVAAVLGIFIIYQVTKPKAAPESTQVDPSILPQAEGYLLGKADAPVQVLEFADFECPACGQFYVLTEPDVRTRLIETGEISYRFFDYPLPGHRNTWAASHAAACANEQGKFWEMHDQIFATQDQWNSEVTNRPKAIFSRLARELLLNGSQWDECFDSQKYKLNIAANQREGDRRMVSSTPTFVVGDKMIRGALGFDQLKAYVDSALAKAPAVAPVPSGDSALSKGVPPAKSK